MRPSTTSPDPDSEIDSGIGALFQSPREESTLDRRSTLARVRHDLLETQDAIRLGRFTILARLGRGAQGSVYAAHDATLERSVALKISRRTGTRALARLQAEARCLARLRHPNLVTVHSLEEHEGRPIVVMERVEGVPLSTWVRDTSPSITAIAVLMAGVADGLVAMHDAGLVHRDVKPENIVVEPGGRARLVDLGLAVDVRDDDARASVGTPGFVAPEQRAGEEVTPAADVYAFAATLHAALAGTPPPRWFGASALPASTPRWLSAVIRRGLDARPDRRPAMARIAAELRRGPLRLRRALAACATLLLATGGTAIAIGAGEVTNARCEARASELQSIWNDDTRAGLHVRLREAGPTGAADLADRTVAGLDGWVDAWSADARTLCTAEPRDGVIVARERCLDAAAEHARALLPLLSDLDATIVHTAPALVAGLPRTDECMDARWSEDQLRRDYDVLPQVLTARAQSSALRRRCEAADEVDCDAGFRAIEADLAGIDRCQWAPHLQLERAALASARGDYEAALGGYEDAAWQAESCGQGSAELSAKRAVADLLTARLGRHDDARRWLRIADAATARLGDPAHARLLLLSARTNLAYAEGRFEASRDLAREALQMFEDMSGTDPGDRAKLLAALGIAEAELQDFASARRHLREAADAVEAVYGPEHPALALALGNLSTVVYVDSLQEALDLNARVLAIYEQWPDTLLPDRATALAQRAAFAAEAHDHDEALVRASEAVVLARRAHGRRHFRVAQLENLLATILLRMGHLPPALAYAESAARASREIQGDDHPDTLVAVQTLADIHAVLEGRVPVRLGG